MDINQESMHIASDEDLIRLNNGYTHPDLIRTVYTPQDSTEQYKYSLGIYGKNSYRTTEIITHDEESTTSEIP